MEKVQVVLLSNAALFGIVLYGRNQYFVHLGWLEHVNDNVYLILKEHLQDLID